MIVDLRDNPGGGLAQALALIGRLWSSTEVAFFERLRGSSAPVAQLPNVPASAPYDGPLFVLVNAGC